MKALLFDMDGTLIDSMRMWRSLEKSYMEQLGVDYAQVDVNQTATMSLKDIVALLNKQFSLDLSVEQAERLVNERISRFYREEARPKPGVVAMLEEFRACGIPMAVGTATPERFALEALAHTGLLAYFDFVQSVTTDGYAKNDKRFYVRAAERFGTTLDELCLFDDALYACVTAKSAGLWVVAVEDAAYEQDRAALKRGANEYVQGFDRWSPRSWAVARGLCGKE